MIGLLWIHTPGGKHVWDMTRISSSCCWDLKSISNDHLWMRDGKHLQIKSRDWGAARCAAGCAGCGRLLGAQTWGSLSPVPRETGEKISSRMISRNRHSSGCFSNVGPQYGVQIPAFTLLNFPKMMKWVEVIRFEMSTRFGWDVALTRLHNTLLQSILHQVTRHSGCQSGTGISNLHEQTGSNKSISKKLIPCHNLSFQNLKKTLHNCRLWKRKIRVL